MLSLYTSSRVSLLPPPVERILACANEPTSVFIRPPIITASVSLFTFAPVLARHTRWNSLAIYSAALFSSYPKSFESARVSAAILSFGMLLKARSIIGFKSTPVSTFEAYTIRAASLSSASANGFLAMFS